MLAIEIIVVLGILIAAILSQVALSKRMRRFYARPCSGRAWRVRFPDATNAEIRDFLSLFCQSFALNQKQRLSLAPDDGVMDIYRAINPKTGGADSLELETLLMLSEERYGVDLARGFTDRTTLGELFCAIRSAPSARKKGLSA